MTTADLTVMGAGIFGLSIAWAAARRGARVQVIDPGGIGAGSSGGPVGALSPHVPEQWNAKKAFQLEALLMAEGWWSDVTEASGIDPGYARTGRLQPLADPAAVALALTRAAGAVSHWQGQAEWRVIPATDHEDWLLPPHSGQLVHDTLSARIQPRRALDALKGAVEARGGIVTAEAAAHGPVVWATGQGGLADTTPPLGSGEKGQAALLAHDARERPQLFVNGLHIVPHANGTVAIGSTSERNWTDPAATDDRLDDLIARARSACPALADAPVIARWAGVRPRANSRAPLLGPHPGRPGHYIANGGYKIGVGIAPLVGEVMADLILDRDDRIPVDFQS